ncbi:cytochrome P450 CYP82D47-like protein [Tanacetum coccineum]
MEHHVGFMHGTAFCRRGSVISICFKTRTAEASTDDDEEVSITANVDGQSKTITEASLRRHLKLEDHDGITSIPNSEIFKQLTLIGYKKTQNKICEEGQQEDSTAGYYTSCTAPIVLILPENPIVLRSKKLLEQERKRKKSMPRKGQEVHTKIQKVELDDEKEDSKSSHSADVKWNCHTYTYRKEVSYESRNDIKDAKSLTYGDYWRTMRKMVTMELVSQRPIEMLTYIRVPEVRASMKDFYEAWVSNKKTTHSDKLHVEIKKLFGNFVLNITTRTISGKRFPPGDKEGDHVLAVVRKFFELLETFVVSDFLPYVKCLDLGGYQKEMKKTAKEMDNIFEGWLQEHRKQRESQEHNEGKDDFMDILLVRSFDSSGVDFFMAFRFLVEPNSSRTILTGGLETHVTLTWALSAPLNNPKALKKAQDELDVHVGRDRLVEESDITNLVYLQAIIKEGMQLYLPLPIPSTHESMDDCIVAGYNSQKALT